MRVDERLNVATITIDFTDEESVLESVGFILSSSNFQDPENPKSVGSKIFTTKVRVIKTLMNYAKHINDPEQDSLMGGMRKGGLGDAKRFLEREMEFILKGNNF